MSYVQKSNSFLPSFLPSFFPSFLPSFLRSLLHSFLRSFLRLFLRSFLRSFVLSFVRSFVPSFLLSFLSSSMLPSVSLFNYSILASLSVIPLRYQSLNRINSPVNHSLTAIHPYVRLYNRPYAR